jgi:hypothetical protein
LETQVSLEVLSDLTDEKLERQLADEELSRRCRDDNDEVSSLHRWLVLIYVQPWWPTSCEELCLQSVYFVRFIAGEYFFLSRDFDGVFTASLLRRLTSARQHVIWFYSFFSFECVSEDGKRDLFVIVIERDKISR